MLSLRDADPTDPGCQSNATIPGVDGPSSKNPDCFADSILEARAIAKQHDLPFFLTEYNNGLAKTNRDDASAAAFLFRNVGLLDQLDLWSWWTFSDIFEEQWMQSSPFHNGFGMMTVQGIRKPIWRGFQLLAGAGMQRLPVSGNVAPSNKASTISVLATMGPPPSPNGSDTSGAFGATGLQLFVANYRRLSTVEWFKCNASTKRCESDPSGAYTDRIACDDACTGSVGERVADPNSLGSNHQRSGAVPKPAPSPPPIPAMNVTVQLDHAADAALPTQAAMRRIDSTHTNPYQLWMDHLGQPAYPTPAQLAKLNNASELVIEWVDITRVSAIMSTLTFAMPGEDSTVHLSL